jgi:hypothetical protein
MAEKRIKVFGKHLYPVEKQEDEELQPTAASATVKVKPTKPTYIRAPEGYTPRFSKDKDHLIEIAPEEIADEDVLCGRVNKGSTHPGNVEFLRVIKFHRNAYQGMGAQHGKKTKLRNLIVDKNFRGRFIRMDEDGTHYLLTEEKARIKVSQALREKSRKSKVA